MMNTSRMEAFSDGVIAILITIMVLEFKVPHEATLASLWSLWPVFLSYLLSFVYLGIYWNNHHHMLQITEKVDGKILWANLHLLFWLSLVPFTTGWVGQTGLQPLPVAVYGVTLFFSGLAYWVLQRTIITSEGPQSKLAGALGKDIKGKSSVILYAVAFGIAFWAPLISCAIYIAVALLWLIPDRRIENKASTLRGR